MSRPDTRPVGEMTCLFEELGCRVARQEPAGPEAARGAVLRVIDTLGVAIQGAQSKVASLVSSYASELAASGPSTILRGGTAPAPIAALCNGVAAHAQDFDDATNVILSGHLSAVLVPAVLAVAEAEGSSGTEAVTAFSAACDIEMAVASVVNPYHYERGFHPTSTLGVIGAAAAAMQLLKCDPAQAAAGFGIAASMCSGLRANFGTMTKPFHVGWAAHNGVTAAYLARSGLTSNPAAFEARLGFGAAYGDEDWRSRDAIAQLESGPVLLRPGVAVAKLWPCCRSIHSTIEAVLKLRAAGGVTAADVESLRIALHPRRLGHVDRPFPADGTDARFSTQYCAAVALRDGAVLERHFADPHLDDPGLQELLRRIEITAEPGTSGGLMDGADFASRVTVVTRDGTKTEEQILLPPGDGPGGVPRADIVGKFRACADPVIGSDRAALLLDRLDHLADLPDVRDLLTGIREQVAAHA